MRIRIAFLTTSTLLVAVATLTHGQNSPPQSPPAQPALQLVGARERAASPAFDVAKLSPLQRQLFISARRGADWLRRANQADGRFEYGQIPALKTPLDGDSYLRQAGAAHCLARASRFLGDERLAAIARQAILALLLDTAPEAGDPSSRCATLPALVANRLGAAAMLTLAIHELPAPGDDLLEQAEQLCNFLRKQQQADGSLRLGEETEPGRSSAGPDAINHYPGQALCALMRSQRHRPAAWKIEVVRKAAAYYRTWWQAHPHPSFAAWQTLACSDAWHLTKEPALAEFVQEMSDVLCSWQYLQLDPRHPLWVGGFMEWADGKPAHAAPQVSSARYAEALLAASGVAQQAGDVARQQRDKDAAERCLQFLVTLQYTDVNTQHFADWYRAQLVGGFHASHQDGNLRIDYTEQAVGALIHYLSTVVATPPSPGG